MTQVVRGRRAARPGAVRLRAMTVGADALELHGRLLDHRSRTDAYLKVVRAVVRPGDVVVDLGSGTGVFGVAAVRAGAARVYAIEASPMARLVRRVAVANGVEQRMTVIRGWSQQVQLPERADVIVSELIGNEPFAEGVLGTTADAVRRFLKPGGRLVPSGLRVLATPMQLPREVRRNAVIGPDRVRRWQEWYGIDFSPLPAFGPDGSAVAYVNPWEARDWKPLGPPTEVRDIELGLRPTRNKGPVSLPVDRPGRLDAVLLHFELRSGNRTFLSTAFDEVDQDNHWDSPVHYLRRPPAVGPRTALAVRYGPDGPGGPVSCAVLEHDGDGNWRALH
ncbi:MAG: Histone-arginine N-methyltransferase [Nocardioides sp.]|nr:Histone-arginine N-methyltransferase [Nocardioides sp.]